MSHLAKSKKTTIYTITEMQGNATVNWNVEYNPTLELVSVRATKKEEENNESLVSFDISESAGRNLASALFGIIDEVCQERSHNI